MVGTNKSHILVCDAFILCITYRNLEENFCIQIITLSMLMRVTNYYKMLPQHQTVLYLPTNH